MAVAETPAQISGGKEQAVLVKEIATVEPIPSSSELGFEFGLETESAPKAVASRAQEKALPELASAEQKPLVGGNSWQLTAMAQSGQSKIVGKYPARALKWSGKLSKEIVPGIWLGASGGMVSHAYELAGRELPQEPFLNHFPDLNRPDNPGELERIRMNGATVQMGLHLQKRFRTGRKLQPYVEAAVLNEQWTRQEFEYAFKRMEGSVQRKVQEQGRARPGLSTQFAAGLIYTSDSGWGLQAGINRSHDLQAHGAEGLKKQQRSLELGVFYAFGG